MGWAGSTYGGIGEVHTGFWWENMRERAHLEDPSTDGRISPKIVRKWDRRRGLD